MTLPAGEVAGERYRIIKQLARGGMGAVYKAWDMRLNRPVALKEMLPQPGLLPELLAQLRQQFESEAQVLATLVHPHLVRVTDYFVWRANQYLVMDFVEGEDLATRIEREGAQDEKLLRTWAQQLLGALGHCHKKKVLHRDIKPQNIIITPENRAVLVDFGLVKLWDPNDPHTKTVMRGAGTPEYAPPEQYDLGSGHTDPRSDIYAFGATLYHAITGHLPPTATQRMANPASFLAPRQIKAELHPTLERAILRAMAVAMPERFQSAAEMAQALQATAVPLQHTTASPQPRHPLQPPSLVSHSRSTSPQRLPQALQPVSRASTAPPSAVNPAPTPRTRTTKHRSTVFTPLLIIIAIILGCVLAIGMGWGALSWLNTLATPDVTTPLPPVETRDAPDGEFSDDFSDPNSGWWVGSTAKGSVRYENGELVIRNYTSASEVTISHAERYFTDSVMQVDSRLVQGTTSNGHIFFCRYTSLANFYAMFYSAEGEYAAFIMHDNIGEWLQEPRSSNAIHKGIEATNAIRLSCQGEQLRFWINDTLLVDLTDATLAEGNIALGVTSLADEYSEVAFDNLVVTVP